MHDLWIMVSKELVQCANRRRFHFEKAAFAAGAAVVLGSLAFLEIGLDPRGAERLAEFSRAAFFRMAAAACALTSAVAFAAASGIVVNERIGRRFDLLRVTSIPVSSIVRGKGAAVIARCMLVVIVLLPVAAVTVLLGGVSFSDMAKAFLMTASAILCLCAAGLKVSVSSQSAVDRAAKAFVMLFLIMLAFWFVPWRVSVWAGSGGAFPSGRSVAEAISPITAWAMLIEGRLYWSFAVVNASVLAVAGLATMRFSRTVRLADPGPRVETAAAPTMRDVMERLRLAAGKVRPGRFVRLPRGFQRLGQKPGWRRTLIFLEMRRASLVPALIPVAAILPIMVFFLAELSISGYKGWRMQDQIDGSADLLAAAILTALALQGFGMFASEKAARTVEQVVVTPVGGRSMIIWKSVSRLAVQALSIALALAAIVLSGIWRGALWWRIALEIIGFGAAVAFVFALSASFSLCCASAVRAAGLFGLFVFVLLPAAYWISSATRFMRGDYRDLMHMAWLGAGTAAILTRNRFGRLSGIVLALGSALAVAGVRGWGALGRFDAGGEVMNSFTFAAAFWQGDTGRTLAMTLVKTFIASALILGMLPGFTEILTAVPERGR